MPSQAPGWCILIQSEKTNLPEHAFTAQSPEAADAKFRPCRIPPPPHTNPPTHKSRTGLHRLVACHTLFIGWAARCWGEAALRQEASAALVLLPLSVWRSWLD